jgi:phosphate-selective porin OprO/OprP
MNKLFPLLFAFIITNGFCYSVIAQENKEPVPDGTEGEVFRDTKNDTVSASKYAHWNEWDGPLTTLKFGGGLLYDFATYTQDAASKEQVELETDLKVRDCRFTLSGKFKFKREVTWKTGLMFDAAEGKWFMRETGVMVKLPEINGHVFVGRVKEGYSMSKVMNGYSIVNMERAMTIDIIPILADGIKYMGYFPKAKIFTNIGFFGNRISEKQTFSTYRWQFVTRVAWLPVYKDMTSPVVHIGVNYRYGEVYNHQLQVRSRPEVNPSPYFVDTKKFDVDNSNHYGFELFYRANQWFFGAEYNVHKMNSPALNNPTFSGGEAFVSYMITGEVRPYMKDFGIFSFIKVKRSVFDGGPGAWEAVLRYSNLDLTDGLISGGEVWRFTPAVNWWLNDHIKIFTAYGFTVLNKSGLEGKTNIFQARVMYMI